MFVIFHWEPCNTNNPITQAAPNSVNFAFSSSLSNCPKMEYWSCFATFLVTECCWRGCLLAVVCLLWIWSDSWGLTHSCAGWRGVVCGGLMSLRWPWLWAWCHPRAVEDRERASLQSEVCHQHCTILWLYRPVQTILYTSETTNAQIN